LNQSKHWRLEKPVIFNEWMLGCLQGPK
jgi:hypothetical protein